MMTKILASTDSKVLDAIEAIHIALNERIAFEASKGKGSDSNIAGNFEDERKLFTNESIARVLVTHSIDIHALFNRATNSSSRINIYTVRKLRDIFESIANGLTLNLWSNHILKNALAFADSNVTMTREDVVKSCDASYKEKDKVKASIMTILSVHKTQGTISSQSSSSIDALSIVGVLHRSKNAQGREVLSLNRESAIAQALITKLV